MSGENSPCFGRKLTEEQKRHLSEINTGELHPRYGQPITDKQKEIMTAGYARYCEENGGGSMAGKHLTDEQKAKDSIAHMGKKNGMYGKIGPLNPKFGKKDPAASKRMTEHNPMSDIKSEDHPMAKLKEEDVIEIRAKYKTNNYTYKQLAQEYNISVHQIANIITYKLWKNTK
jgi:hypothetical protein